MPDLTSKIMQKIQGYQLDQLPLDKDMIMPYYQGLSLVNVPCTISRLLSVPDFGKAPLEDAILQEIKGPYKKVILLLVDALGYRLFDRLLQSQQVSLWNKFFERAVFSPLTSICPSTTASALTSLWTGEGPGAHGIIGYEMWAKEFGMVMNNILHSPASARGDSGGLVRSGFDPKAFLNNPLLGTHLAKHNVKTTTLIHSAIARSGLSLMQMEDVDLITYVDEADLCINLANFLNQRQGTRDYVYVYYSDVDTLMHRYNDKNLRVDLQFELFSNIFEKAFINRLSTAVASDTLLILMADHGSIATPRYSKYDLVHHPELTASLVMQPTCENRLAFFYVKPGKEGAIRDYFTRTWPDEFILINSEVALENGLFGEGPFNENVHERLGDLIAVARGDAYLWWAQKQNVMAGRHGGLSREEMLIPFYALPLGAVL